MEGKNRQKAREKDTESQREYLHLRFMLLLRVKGTEQIFPEQCEVNDKRIASVLDFYSMPRTVLTSLFRLSCFI